MPLRAACVLDDGCTDGVHGHVDEGDRRARENRLVAPNKQVAAERLVGCREKHRDGPVHSGRDDATLDWEDCDGRLGIRHQLAEEALTRM